MKTFMNFQGCVVPKEDLDVYDNHADMSSDDVNHTVSVKVQTTCASSALEDEELMMESVSSSNIMFQSKDSLSLSVQSLTLEVAEPSSEVARHALINGDNDGNKVDPIGSSRSGPPFDVRNSIIPSETLSCTCPQVLFDSQSEHVPLADNDVETNSEDNLDDETDCITVTNAVDGVDSRSKLNF
ncbi:hypothetical protein YC2023_028379 [Brassica napus]